MIVDGKAIAKSVESDLKKKLEKLSPKKVCFVMFGENVASSQFVGMKVRMAERLGVEVVVKSFPDTLETQEASDTIEKIVAEGYDGMVVQLPLPVALDTQAVLNCVPPEMDIDVLSEKAKAIFASGSLDRIPPVARAVFRIFDVHNISLKDKYVLVVGSGKLVGEPVAAMLRAKGVPLSMVDKNTPEAERVRHLKSADIVISGVGSPHFIKPSMIKSGVVLIDAGTSEQAGKLVGDIDPSCGEKASLITPVPGGVGPITVVSLFENLCESVQ